MINNFVWNFKIFAWKISYLTAYKKLKQRFTHVIKRRKKGYLRKQWIEKWIPTAQPSCRSITISVTLCTTIAPCYARTTLTRNTVNYRDQRPYEHLFCTGDGLFVSQKTNQLHHHQPIVFPFPLLGQVSSLWEKMCHNQLRSLIISSCPAWHVARCDSNIMPRENKIGIKTILY